ncbi:MAG: hypothetical protein JXB15_04515 [Anaerolineales bacterium]|nr:hypothetical protein [Anaerolineales bacterium]
MKIKWLKIMGLAALTACLLTGAAWANSNAPANPLADHFIFFPAVQQKVPAAALEPLVVNHLHTDAGDIPDYWIEQARKYVVHYAHTSHGSQVLTGLDWLESRDARFNVDIQANGSVVLPGDTTALRVYDGNNYSGSTYITPDMYWESASGMDHTRSVANTSWFDFSLWTWCGQMSYYSDEQIQDYIDVMDQFEGEYTDMRFIYYTGHTDGSAPGSDLWRHNDLVRQYVQDNQKVLFDFADIESYTPSGTFYPTATDSCGWCAGWCAAHPANFECQDLPATDSECAHTHGLQCTLKGQAFWWLMARMAGWDGNPSQ